MHGVTFNLDLSTYTGNMIAHTVDTFADGTMEGIIVAKFTGIKAFTYNGPTFSFDLGNGFVGTVTNGRTYTGLTYEGIGVKHGVSGELDGIQLKEEFFGANIRIYTGATTYFKVDLVENHVTFMTTGKP
jgi:hypothetical protein